MAFSAVTSHECLLLILCTEGGCTGAGISKQTVALVMLCIPARIHYFLPRLVIRISGLMTSLPNMRAEGIFLSTTH